jgi:hypothetical protein
VHRVPLPLPTDGLRAVNVYVVEDGGGLARCLAAVQAGAATAYQAAGFLRWTRRERRLAELDSFNQMLAVIETRAHLELLVAQGRLAGSGSDSVTFYQVAAPPG